MSLQPTFCEHTINQLVLMFKDGQINLEPGFQRDSVWTTQDRKKLIESIVVGYPVPSIFLYRRSKDGKLVYDVIDGKQRLETILMYLQVGRFKKSRFAVRVDLGQGRSDYEWPDLCRASVERRVAVEAYKLQTVEVTGELCRIIDLFVRINSTGKPLTTGEKRHAKFYNSPFLKKADALVRKNQRYFLDSRILSRTQFDRMKGTELVAELLMSIHQGGPINKKTALDRAIGNESVHGATLDRLVREFRIALHHLKRMFPDLPQTRFRNSAEFYSLLLLVWHMWKDKCVLTDRKSNRLAFELLRKLSSGVDQLRESLRKAETGKPTERLFADYLLTVQGDTDSSANRTRRREILQGLVLPLYERQADRRHFSIEQRRILWNSDADPVCGNSQCTAALTWDDFTIDHIVPYSRGGRTRLPNGQLMCRSCNSRKGARV